MDNNTTSSDNCGQHLHLGNKTILIVQGEWITSFFIAEYLGLQGKNLAIISNTPKEVMEEKPHNVHIDLIINVIRPTEIYRRYELTKKLRQRYKETPIIVNGAIETYREVDACYEAGCGQYIPLPIDMGLFDSTLDKYLGR